MSAYTEIPKIKAQNGELPPKVLGHLDGKYTSASHASVTYWVSPTGDDNNPGTQSQPLATIAAAITKLPDVIREGHEYTISLMVGDWQERLDVSHINILGKLTVQGSTPDRYSHTILDAYTRNTQGHYVIKNIHSSKTVPGVHFHYSASGPRMEVINCSGSGEVTDEPYSSGNQGVLADYGSSVIVENSKFDYKDYALRANYGSNLVSRDNTGIGNTHGIGARFGGRIETYGTMPHGYAGTTTFSSGGTVVHETGGHVGVQRYNEYLEKKDTFGLVDQYTLQGQGNITPTKHWVSRASTTRQGEMTDGGTNIPDGSTLRTYFQMTTNISCTLAIDVTAVWAPVEGSARRFLKAFVAPTITSTEARSTTLEAIATGVGSGASPQGVISVGHTGLSGTFYLDFTPNGGSSIGQYGLDIRISNMRHYDAPIMLGAEVVT